MKIKEEVEEEEWVKVEFSKKFFQVFTFELNKMQKKFC